MGYRFRTDLSKTKVCSTVGHFTGMDMPRLRDIEFKKHSGTYWLRFYSGDGYYKVTFSAAFGCAYVRSEKYDFDRGKYSQVGFIKVPFEYLLGNGCLREVA